MVRTLSIAELQRAGVAIRAEEAVAIAQKLIHDARYSTVPAAAPPFGPPSAETVFLADDGSVTCRGCEATPSVAEIAILLQTLLPEGAPQVSGPLRYTIARALHDVDAPPFDSLGALSFALRRYERGDRDRIVSRLMARAAGPDAADGTSRGSEDRRHGRVTPSDYRRHLREADERLYQQKLALDAAAAAEPAAAPPSRRRVLPVALAVVLGLLVVAAAEAMRMGVAAAVAPPSPPASPAWTQPAPPRLEERPAPAPSRPSARSVRHRLHVAPPPRPHRSIASVLLAKLHLIDDSAKR